MSFFLTGKEPLSYINYTSVQGILEDLQVPEMTAYLFHAQSRLVFDWFQTWSRTSLLIGFQNNSPASTLSESAPANAFSLNLFPNVLRNIPALTPSRLVVRSDPSILTCFDPADKEIYELWAPKTWCWWPIAPFLPSHSLNYAMCMNVSRQRTSPNVYMFSLACCRDLNIFRKHDMYHAVFSGYSGYLYWEKGKR